jgi:PBSX family phage terminase large subunit
MNPQTTDQQTIEIPIEYKELFDDWWREAAIHGGRGSLKSHTVGRFFLIRARQRKYRFGCFREFQNSIAESSHQLLSDLIALYKLNEFKVTDNAIVNTLTGSDFLFKGLHHNEQSIKSIEGLDYAWVEEAQTVSANSIDVLVPTVRKPGSKIIYTYNRLKTEDPVHKRLVIEGRPNTLVLNVNYDVAMKHGLFPEVLRAEMEDDKERRPNLYRHKWLGEPNNLEGRVYKDWAIIDEIPHEAQLMRRGLDFGYSIDPAAIVDVYYYNGGYILSERLYRKRMLNNELIGFMSNLNSPNTLIMADSAEPKSIAEIAMEGIPIIGVNKKGTKEQGYLNYSIDYMQQQRISVTKASKNLISEYEDYLWATDKDGKSLNKPEEGKDHALDAARYAFDGLRPQKEDKDNNHTTGNISSMWR